MFTLMRFHLALFLVTLKTLGILVWTLPFSNHFQADDTNAFPFRSIFESIFTLMRFHQTLSILMQTEGLNASKCMRLQMKCTSVDRALVNDWSSQSTPAIIDLFIRN